MEKVQHFCISSSRLCKRSEGVWLLRGQAGVIPGEQVSSRETLGMKLASRASHHPKNLHPALGGRWIWVKVNNQENFLPERRCRVGFTWLLANLKNRKSCAGNGAHIYATISHLKHWANNDVFIAVPWVFILLTLSSCWWILGSFWNFPFLI